MSVLYEVVWVRKRLAICGNDSKSRTPMLPCPTWAPLPGRLHKDRAVAPKAHRLVPGPPRAILGPVLIPTVPTSFETESLARKVLLYESTETSNSNIKLKDHQGSIRVGKPPKQVT